jgi:hypothetical protein
MDEQRDGETPRRYEETSQPQNPPNSVLSKDARRGVVLSYFVPVVVLFAVVGLGLVYWANRPEGAGTSAPDRSEVGTVGRTDGGFQPDPKPGSVSKEIDYRGDDLSPIIRVEDLDNVDGREMAGRRVAIGEAEVESVSGNTLWVKGNDRKVAVIIPQAAQSVKAGDKVSISGRLAADANGAAQISAERVQVKS